MSQQSHNNPQNLTHKNTKAEIDEQNAERKAHWAAAEDGMVTKARAQNDAFNHQKPCAQHNEGADHQHCNEKRSTNADRKE